MNRAFAYTHHVPFEETNLVGNVYFAHYVRWQGLCREAFLIGHAPEVLAALSDGGLLLVTVACSVEYFEECFAGDEVQVRMRLAASSGNRLDLAFDYRRGDGTVAAGRQTVACLRREVGRLVPAAWPDALLRALDPFR